MVLKGPDCLQEQFELLATKVDVMIAGEATVVALVTIGPLEDEIVTVGTRRQEFDVHRRHIGAMVNDPVQGVNENDPQLHTQSCFG